jgi:hypothetical protein
MEAPFLPPVSAGFFWCLVFAVCPNRASVNALRFRNLEGSGTHWQRPADQIVSNRKDARGFTA